jgi:DNA polymerase-3 subunit delta
MGDSLPTVYYLYGDDDLAMEEIVAQIKARLGAPDVADLNFTRFEVKSHHLGLVAEACGTAPFLAARRVVVVEEAGRLAKSASAKSELDAMMLGLPASTALVLLDPIDLSRRTSLPNHQRRSFLYQWTHDHSDLAFVQICARKRGQAFIRWLLQRSQEQGFELEVEAAERLATYVLDDPHMANQELRKLADYVALAHLHKLLADEDPIFAFAMIVRQFRLILQAREALDSGRNPSEVLDAPAFVVKKVSAQADNFTMPQLETIYRKLGQIDYESKVGGPELAVAMDGFVGAIGG